MHGVSQIIQRFPVGHAERTLGIHLSPDGKDSTQEKVLLGKSRTWETQLRGSFLPKHLALQAYTTTIDKSLSYPTVATCLTRKQSDSIQAPALSAAL
jgi:hypothetical protein